MFKLRKIIKNSKGATAIEYGLIAALVGIGAIAGMKGLAGALNNTYNAVGTKMAVS